ncbi:hypothetical protein [Paraclostridium sordellii]|nr:hypothetical protein [Paeniclostridium sordellii]
MRELKSFVYWMIHLFGCPEEDLELHYGNSLYVCKKCGRTTFRWVK